LMDPLPKNHAENVALVKKAIAQPGLKVIVAQRECIHNRRKAKAAEKPSTATCTACGQ
jgi:TPP-dependent indolepyruvate ferredoxin oxidoreductase alpha subunit